MVFIAPPACDFSSREWPNESLLSSSYDRLRRMAASLLRNSSVDWSSSVLAHETCLRLLAKHGQPWSNQRQLLIVAAVTMRRILLNQHRNRQRLKRGGGTPATSLEQDVGQETTPQPETQDLHRALDELSKIAPRQRDLIDLRFFQSRSIDDTARRLGVSRATVIREWRRCREWLKERLDRR